MQGQDSAKMMVPRSAVFFEETSRIMLYLTYSDVSRMVRSQYRLVSDLALCKISVVLVWIATIFTFWLLLLHNKNSSNSNYTDTSQKLGIVRERKMCNNVSQNEKVAIQTTLIFLHDARSNARKNKE